MSKKIIVITNLIYKTNESEDCFTNALKKYFFFRSNRMISILQRSYKNPHKNVYSFICISKNCNQVNRMLLSSTNISKWLKWPELYELLLPTLIRRPSDDNGFCTHERLQSSMEKKRKDNVRNISHIWIWMSWL